ncbi:MAG: hypothetical protein ABIT64_05855 [Lysobacteraceae bacterium]
MNEPTLAELLQMILRDAGFLMTGGSAQFRESALKDLQLSLRVLQERAADAHLVTIARELADRASLLASSKEPSSSDSMNMRNTVTSFESAMKAYIKTARHR